MLPPEQAIIQAARSVDFTGVAINTLAFQKHLACLGYVVVPLVGVTYNIGSSRKCPGALKITLDGLYLDQAKGTVAILDTYDECARSSLEVA